MVDLNAVATIEKTRVSPQGIHPPWSLPCPTNRATPTTSKPRTPPTTQIGKMNMAILKSSPLTAFASESPRPSSPQLGPDNVATANPSAQWATRVSESNTKRIHLTDAEIETAQVFRSFLELVTEGTLTLNWDTRLVVLFLQRWDCKPALSLTLELLEQSVRTHSECSVTAFWIGASLDNIELCALVLSMHPTAIWSPRPLSDECERYHNVSLGSSWNSNTWSTELRGLMPSEYACALGWAYLAVGKSMLLGERFRLYMYGLRE